MGQPAKRWPPTSNSSRLPRIAPEMPTPNWILTAAPALRSVVRSLERLRRSQDDIGRKAGQNGRELVRPERFELPTCCSGGNRSIQLSYGRTWDMYSLHAVEKGSKPEANVRAGKVRTPQGPKPAFLGAPKRLG